MLYLTNLLLHHTKWGKTETLFSKVRNKTSISTLSTFIQCSIGVPRQQKKQKKKFKWVQTEKEEFKLSIFPDDMILYLNIPKIPSKTPRSDKHFLQCSSIENHIKKSVTFLYNNNDQIQKEIR
jgi:hypothetical protein